MFKSMIATAILSLSLGYSTATLASPDGYHWDDIKKAREAFTDDATEQSIRCLAQNIYFESRGEGTQGWLAVAFVTINRVIDPRFPNDICSVVFEPKQFSWTHDGISDEPDLSYYPDKKAWQYILEFSRGFLENAGNIEDPTSGSLYYHRYDVEPSWKDSYDVAVVIGEHVFYINNNAHR